MLDDFSKIMRLSIVVVTLLLLGACANTVTVKGQVPTPLVEKIPLSADLIYSDEFKNYTYSEEDKARALKSLNFGSAQIDMFNDVFSAILSQPDENRPDRDLTIRPEIIDFQYTVPRETKSKLYEVWLKYRLRISNSSNQELADWVVKGYGKTPTATFTSTTSAFNSAANVALRDVGAQLSIGFARQPSIKALVDDNSRSNQTANEQLSDESEVRQDD